MYLYSVFEQTPIQEAQKDCSDIRLFFIQIIYVSYNVKYKLYGIVNIAHIAM